jgi:shikimate kinase
VTSRNVTPEISGMRRVTHSTIPAGVGLTTSRSAHLRALRKMAVIFTVDQ